MMMLIIRQRMMMINVIIVVRRGHMTKSTVKSTVNTRNQNGVYVVSLQI